MKYWKFLSRLSSATLSNVCSAKCYNSECGGALSHAHTVAVEKFLQRKSTAVSWQEKPLSEFKIWQHDFFHNLTRLEPIFFNLKLILCFINKTIFYLLIDVILIQVNVDCFLTYASFIIRLELCLWPTDIKLFTSLIYECRPFQPSLMFVRKSSK